jgi:hypothetical protein
MQTITIARRFRGPPNSGNGGYVCGMLARYITGAAEVTLRAPPPLETTDDRTLMLTRYTELPVEQKMLVQQLNLTLPPQPPPRITAQEISPSGPSAQCSGDLCLRRRDLSGFPVVLTVQLGKLGFSNGPGNVKSPGAAYSRLASVDGHRSFPLQERSCPLGQWSQHCSHVSPAGYLLLSVVSAKGCQHDAVRGEVVSTI